MRKRQSRSPVIDQRKQLYGTARWKRLRAATLKASPRCWRCGGKAQSVDHIHHDDANARFFDPANVRSCCIPCNSTLAAAGRREVRLRSGGSLSRSDHPASTHTQSTQTLFYRSVKNPPKPNHLDALFDRMKAKTTTRNPGETT